MKNSEIREIFFSYFSKKGHHKVLSAPLIPAKDPTLLFTNAGMNQFKSVFLQEEKREYNRAVSIQKCMRVSGKHNDFDEVGKSEFHHTFFEMLGNFSFGDYFKEKAIEYGWELLTDFYKFDPEKLWVTVFKEDDEAFRIWEKHIGVPSHKIIRLGEKDNFWQMGETGPCGPCSEIHFDRGDSYGPAGFSEEANNRYIEVWNLVFMQFSRDEQGKLNPLPAPSIDTGMGMERLTCLLQGKSSNYQTDLFRPIIEFTAGLANIDPQAGQHQIDLNVIADHSRALTFLIADGVLPANDGRGYVLRRILRRAAKHGKALGFNGPFLGQVCGAVVDLMKAFYPELEYSRDFIARVLQAEEEKFNQTLANGLKRFDELLEKARESQDKTIPGAELFKLSDTYGFPLDFAVDLANEKDIGVDRHGFLDELEKQRERSRISLEQKQKAVESLENLDRYQSIFTGYDNLEENAVISAIYQNNRQTGTIEAGQEGIFVFDRTPFYAESGGQVGDTGTGRSDTAFFTISGTKKGAAVENSPNLHLVQMKSGTLKVGDPVTITVDKERRENTAVHHSSTHLLQYALREVLGLHVKQSGSYVDPDKLRFDFTHYTALTPRDIEQVEAIVNRKIMENNPLQTEILPYEQALAKGAIAIFEEKYADVVRLITIGDFSRELCGGTHLRATGQAGIFKITRESSISSGIRRIEAVAGAAGYRSIHQHLSTLAQIQEHFRQKQEDIFAFLVNMEKDNKEKDKLLKKTAGQKAAFDLDKLTRSTAPIAGIQTLVEHIDGLDRKQLSTIADEIKNRTHGAAVLSTNIDGKSAFVVSLDPGVANRLNAGKIIREIAQLVNGSGGGRPDFAQAGGESIKDVEIFKKDVTIIIEKMLSG